MLNYLVINNLYIYKGNIYKKIKNYKISYIKFGSIEEVLYDKFQENRREGCCFH